ncbi:hypothetical protein GCM10020331_099020 [Ectobacillus funiculus]
MHHLQDEEIKPLTKVALEISEGRLDKIKQIFIKENFPVPRGFAEDDVNLSAPPLFHDIFFIKLYLHDESTCNDQL